MVSRGEGQLNRLRDEAKAIAPELGFEKEAGELSAVIGALLGTEPASAVSDKANIVRAQARPYDTDRVKLLERLALELREVHTPDFRPAPDIRGSVHVLHTFAFMEAYFSNFIEGTEFEVDEAKRVVFEGLKIPRRQDDTHDILNTYRLVADTYEMSRLPESAAGFLELLKARHLAILEHRKAKNPGEWKDLPNRAGNTRFVEPALVEGTLAQAFDLYKALPHSLARAIFMQIAVSEVHPFNDGNGRLSRVMMNAELTKANECRIIIPTVYRDDYITALKAFSQNRDTGPVIRVFERAHAFTASMDYLNYEAAKESFTRAQAFKDPREGRLTFSEKRLTR
jgi:Fic family protein